MPDWSSLEPIDALAARPLGAVDGRAALDAWFAARRGDRLEPDRHGCERLGRGDLGAIARRGRARMARILAAAHAAASCRGRRPRPRCPRAGRPTSPCTSPPPPRWRPTTAPVTLEPFDDAREALALVDARFAALQRDAPALARKRLACRRRDAGRVSSSRLAVPHRRESVHGRADRDAARLHRLARGRGRDGRKSCRSSTQDTGTRRRPSGRSPRATRASRIGNCSSARSTGRTSHRRAVPSGRDGRWCSGTCSCRWGKPSIGIRCSARSPGSSSRGRSLR